MATPLLLLGALAAAVTPVEPLAATPEMAEWAKEVTAVCGPAPEGRLACLQRALFAHRDGRFDYAEDLTLTAQQAFEQRRGNCFSFTSLFIALGRSMGIDVRPVSVARVVEVSLEGDLVVVSRHMVAAFDDGPHTWTYDFRHSEDEPTASWRTLSDVHIAGLYHVNHGTWRLRQGALEEAREHLEVAVDLAPDSAAAWVDLGVTRRRLGDLVGAEAAYREALRVEPGAVNALSNLAALYRLQGNPHAALDALRESAAADTNPWTRVALAHMEMDQGNHRDAMRILRAARRRHPHTPEILDAMSRWAEELGRPGRAARLERRAARMRVRLSWPG